jgi:ACS family D-galactonate transporter-like MFS transporter
MRPGVVVTRDSGASTLSKSAPRRWLIIALLFFAVLVNYIDRGNLSIVAVPLMRDFHASAARMGTLLSAFFWSYALLQIPAGYVVDRFGLKWTYAGAFLVWSIASAAVGFAETFAQIVFLRLMLGVGEAAAQPVSLTFIRRNFAADQQGLPTAVYLSGMSFGPAIGAIVGASLLSIVGWRMLFIITGFGACVWILPWLLTVPRDAGTAMKPVSPKESANWSVLLRRPTLWGVTLGAFFYSYFWYYCLTWLPSYLVMERGFSFLKMGGYTAAPLFGMAVVSMLSGRLADRLIARFGKPIVIRKIFVVTGFLLGSSILLLLAAKSPALTLAVLMLSLLGIGVASANYWALTQAASPAPMIGRVIGCQNTVANLAGICAPMLTGFLVDRTKSFSVSITFAGVSLLIAAAAFLFLVRQRDVDEFQAFYPG